MNAAKATRHGQGRPAGTAQRHALRLTWGGTGGWGCRPGPGGMGLPWRGSGASAG